MFLSYLVTILFTFLTCPSFAVDSKGATGSRIKNGESWNPENTKTVGAYLGAKPWQKLAGPHPEDARSVLDLVATNAHKKYTMNMQKRTDHLNAARKIKDRFPTFFHDTAPQKQRNAYNQHQYAAWGGWFEAFHYARTNRVIASTIKNVRTTHKPRWNDYRRWGYEPSESDLERLSLPSGITSKSQQQTLPPASSRTYSTPFSGSPWERYGWGPIGKPGKRHGWPAGLRTANSQSLGGFSGLSSPPRSSRLSENRSRTQSSEKRKWFGSVRSPRKPRQSKSSSRMAGSLSKFSRPRPSHALETDSRVPKPTGKGKQTRQSNESKKGGRVSEDRLCKGKQPPKRPWRP